MCFANKNLSENELKCKRSMIKKHHTALVAY